MFENSKVFLFNTRESKIEVDRIRLSLILISRQWII